MILAVAAILAGFQVLLALAGRTMHESGMFLQIAALLPPFVRQILGPGVASVMSYAGVAAVGYFHVAVTAAIVGLAIALGTEPAAEIESGFADLVLARPVARRAPIVRSAAVIVIGLSIVVLGMVLGTRAGSAWIAPPGAAAPSPRLVVSLAANLWALGLAWGGIALALASMSRRRAAAGSIAGLAALVAYLLDYLGRLWSPAAIVAKLSPFHYFSGFDLVGGRDLPVAHLVVLLATGAVSGLVAFAAFSRRDV